MANVSRRGSNAESEHVQDIASDAPDDAATAELEKELEPPTEDLDEEVPFDHPPDGGLKAWLQVVGAFFIFFSTWGVINTFGAFQTYYSQELLSNTSESDISWIGSIQAFLLLAATVIGGPLCDLGYAKELLIGSSMLAVFGMMMTSICKEYWQFVLAQGICTGIGLSGAFIPSIAIVPTYFTSRRAFALGISASGSSVGGVLFPVIFHRLQPRIGFPWTTRVLAFIMLATLCVSIALMRVRITSSNRRSLVDLDAFKNKRYSLFVISQFCGFTGLYIPFFYVQQYSKSMAHTSPNLAFYTLAILNAGSFFGRIIPGFLADSLGAVNTLLFCAIASTVLAFCWIAIKDTAGILVFCALYGFCSGTFVSLQAATVSSLVPHMRIVGTWMGMTAFISGLGLLVGTPVAGVILNSGYLGLQLFCGATIAVATIFIGLTAMAISKHVVKSEA